jgi:hypothetical protein
MKNRNLAFVTIMSIITLGIYDAYLLHLISKDFEAKGHKIPPVLLPAILFYFLAILWTAVSLLVLLSIDSPSSPFDPWIKTMFIIAGPLSIAFLVTAVIWAYKFCKAAEAVTNGKLEFAQTYALCLVLWVFGLWFMWPVKVQKNLNEPKTQPPVSVSSQSASSTNF